MTPNHLMVDAMYAFGLQVTEIEAEFNRAIEWRLRRISSEIVSAMDAQDGVLRSFHVTQLPSVIARTVDSYLEQLVADIRLALLDVTIRAGHALPFFIQHRQATEQLDLSLLDPFGLTDLNEDESAFDILADLLGITEDEARELFAELMLFGIPFEVQWRLWQQKQIIQLQQRLAGTASQLQVALINDQPNTRPRTTDEMRRQLRDSLVGRSATSTAYTVKGLTSSMLHRAVSGTILRFRSKNGDKFSSEYMWAALLDSRTCKRCRRLHKQRFRYGSGPLPPLHPLCRCTPIALLQGGGAVVIPTFNEWLLSRSYAVQESLMGPRAASSLRWGSLRFRDFPEFRSQFGPRDRSLPSIRNIAS